MKHNGPTRLEKIGLFLCAVILAGALIGLWLPLRSREQPLTGRLTETSEPTETTEPEPTLSGPEFFLPEGLNFGEKLPVTTFQNREGRTVDLLESYPNTRLVLMYWGSWCPHCEQQLESLAQFMEIAQAEGDTKIILINKTDPDKEETVEVGEAYLSEKGWLSVNHVYDVDLTAYCAYGMKRIPTTVVVDGEGYVRAVSSEVLDAEAFYDLLEEAKYGNAKKQLAYLKANMMNADGGVYTASQSTTASSPQGHDVLSESMGLLMCCAVRLEDEELFSQCWSHVSQTMQREGLITWYVAEDGTQGNSNALLDDLRIVRALYEAHEKWGGYEEARTQLASALAQKNVYRGQLSSFYDFSQGKSGDTIALAYGDFETLNLLAEIQPEFAELSQSLLEIVQEGYLGEQFPLYSSSYNYQRKEYSQDDLNTAEALLTVYHLSQVGLAREETLSWLKNALKTDTLAARYHVDGTVVEGYRYDSTAVFAIAALIGQAAGDGDIYHLARLAMERSWVSDEDSALYGAFALDSNVQSFDQLLPLTVYTMGRDAKF